MIKQVVRNEARKARHARVRTKVSGMSITQETDLRKL